MIVDTASCFLRLELLKITKKFHANTDTSNHIWLIKQWAEKKVLKIMRLFQKNTTVLLMLRLGPMMIFHVLICSRILKLQGSLLRFIILHFLFQNDLCLCYQLIRSWLVSNRLICLEKHFITLIESWPCM